MYKTLNQLYRCDLGSFNSRLKTIKKLNLNGIGNTQIVYCRTVELVTRLREVHDLYNSTSVKGYNKEVLLLNSFSSATIEGARTTVDNVKFSLKNGARTKDDKMVLNVVSATSYALKRGINSDIDLVDVWKMVTDGVLENASKQGAMYRSGMVYIGNNCKIVHTPESVENIPYRIKELFNFKNSDLDGILKAIICHFYFVYIHPMCDGNGRTARILQQVILNDEGYVKFNSMPVVSMINKNLSGYYSSLEKSEDVFKREGYHGILDITPFILYSLNILYDSLYEYDKNHITLSEVDKKILSKVHKGSSISVKKASIILKISEDKTRNILNRLSEFGFFSKKKEGIRNIYIRL